MVHLIFGNTAAACLKHAFRKRNHQIIGSPIDFSVGPIRDIHQPDGIEEHFVWKASSFREVGNYHANRSAYQEALKQLSEIKDGDKLTIWTCENASEQIGLRISCYLLKNKNVELTLVNTAQAMQEYMKGKDIDISIRMTGDCNGKQLLHFYDHLYVSITKEMRQTFEQEGKELLQRGSLVRSWKQRKIIDELETRDDAYIIKYVKKLERERGEGLFINTAQVVGGVLGEVEHILSDAWIEYRIRSLIQAGKFKYDGSLQAMRMYRIKTV
ncbi:DUF1835 domain-containing protein [Oceanobacillus sp. J11TS1]|uniref:DUF1835 domain-containing protein n=1 Tax=Oceanobacillus sp. J11TS1 TaxID=2807191 RepID=UPI001B0D249F|nr:DUF1835 domain-containing protein [Oceanobacillus sp. J11TS1]GIO22715.1 hypothetical protein J11TS1_12960 [Oceanobacillus sp. J11TS1]